MAIRFRKTVKLAPGIKLNIGKKSASIRMGGKNAGYTVGTKGRTTSASIPGTGLGVTSRTNTGGADINWLTVIGWVGGGFVLLLVLAALFGAFSGR